MTKGRAIAFRCVCIECEPEGGSPPDTLIEPNHEAGRGTAALNKVTAIFASAGGMLARFSPRRSLPRRVKRNET